MGWRFLWCCKVMVIKSVHVHMSRPPQEHTVSRQKAHGVFDRLTHFAAKYQKQSELSRRHILPRAVGVTIHEKVLLSSPHRHTLYWQPSQFLKVYWSESVSVTFTCRHTNTKHTQSQKQKYAQSFCLHIYPNTKTTWSTNHTQTSSYSWIHPYNCCVLELKNLPWCTWRDSWRPWLWVWTPPLGWQSRAKWDWQRTAGRQSVQCWATRRSPPRRHRKLRLPTLWWCQGLSSPHPLTHCLCANTWARVRLKPVQVAWSLHTYDFRHKYAISWHRDLFIQRSPSEAHGCASSPPGVLIIKTQHRHALRKCKLLNMRKQSSKLYRHSTRGIKHEVKVEYK